MYETVQTAPRETKQIQDIKHATSRRHSFWFQQWSDTCDTSLAVESALCTTGSPRRWCQRVSRKCYESVGAAKGVITSPLKHHGPWIMMDHHDKSASQLWRTSLDWAAASSYRFFDIFCLSSWPIESVSGLCDNMWQCMRQRKQHHEKQSRFKTSSMQHHAGIPSDFSNDQTHAIPHWLWNQPSAPPVHPEGDVKGCLGNAMKVSEPQKVSSHHLWNIMDHGSWWIIMTSRQVNSEGLR